MAEYTLSKIKLPNSDICNIKDATGAGRIVPSGTSVSYNGSTYTVGSGCEVFNDYTNNKVAGNYTHSEGHGTFARGNYSHAEGEDTVATGNHSHAEGDTTEASGECSHAEGYATSATGGYAHTEGHSTTASGNYSHAEGYNTASSGNYSHAEGQGVSAASPNQHVQGKFNKVDSNGVYAFIIGNGTGTATNARSNAFAIDWDGKIYVNNAATGVDVSSLVDSDGAISAVYGKGTNITASSGNEVDLDSYKTVGVYNILTSGVNYIYHYPTREPEGALQSGDTLYIDPSLNNGGRLEVRTARDANKCAQIFYPDGLQERYVMFQRYYSYNATTQTEKWGPWKAVVSKDYIFGRNASAIEANDDLHSEKFTRPGVYISETSETTDTLDNCPVSGSGFRLVVTVIGRGTGPQNTTVNRIRHDLYKTTVGTEITSGNTDQVWTETYTATNVWTTWRISSAGMDTTPTANSVFGVESGGVYTAITNKPGVKVASGTTTTYSSTTYTAGSGCEIFNDYTNNKAAGNYSYANGYSSQALGNYSYAGGNQSVATGAGSYAFGESCVASGTNSHAEGTGCTAASDNQFVIGKNNAVDNSNQYAFIIGGGFDDGAPIKGEPTRGLVKTNIFAIDWTGKVYVAGASAIDLSALKTYDGVITAILGEPPTANRIIPTTSAHANLNDYNTPGVYVCRTSALSQYVENSPVSTLNDSGNSKGFRLEVIQLRDGNYIRQEIRTWAEPDTIYTRTRNGTSSWGSSAWYKFTGTAV